MINHARTLLLNYAPSGNHVSIETAGEYVPPEFRPIALSNPLKLIRRVLFGSRPDARFMNLRIRELMGYIHQTELAEYVYALDPRVTYWPLLTTDFFENSKKTVHITQINGRPQKLTIVGNFQANPLSGSALYQYLLTVGTPAPNLPMRALALSANYNLIAGVQQFGVNAAPEITSVGTSSSATVGVLPNTDLKVILNFADDPAAGTYASLLTEGEDAILYENRTGSGAIVSDQQATQIPLMAIPEIDEIVAQWFITLRASPPAVITTLIPTLELLGEPVFLQLFGVNDKEPYVTFKNLWFDHYAPAYRLAGLILAVIYRTEELRTSKNG